ncbi:MAG: ankyrin repeat domain-containing protein [Candidatus Babeliales bacterium]
MVSRIIFTRFITGLFVCTIGVGTLVGMKKEETFPLIAAVEQGDMAAVQALISGDADINKQGPGGMTPLMVALMSGNFGIFNLLVETGKIDFGKRDENGNTVLDLAINNPDVTKQFRDLIATATINCKYRNLIILLDNGGELAGTSNAVLGDLISALKDQHAFVIITAELWDYFLRAKYVTDAGGFIDAQRLVKKQQEHLDGLEMYKICLHPKPHIPPEDQKADFYIFSPTTYTEMLQKYSTLPRIKEELLQSGYVQKAKAAALINDLSYLGINLPLKAYKVLKPFDECGELGKILNKYPQLPFELRTTIDGLKNRHAAQEGIAALEFTLKKQEEDVNRYAANRDQTLGPDFLLCLRRLLVFKEAQKELDQLVAGAVKLPHYNVYLHGHGHLSELPPETDALMYQAQQLGFWPTGGLEVVPEKTFHKFRMWQKTISSQLLRKEAIAALPSNIFGEMLEWFNGVTNFLFVATCHAASAHLVLPFVFMSSPHLLSYTIAVKSLVDASSYVNVPTVPSADIGSVSNLDYAQFFEGVSDFAYFIKIQEKFILSSAKPNSPPEPRNYFARLLNYVGSFLDRQGRITKDPSGRERAENTPWIKLPGTNDWQVVSHMDDQIVVITETMMKVIEQDNSFAQEVNPETGQKRLAAIFQKRLNKEEEEKEIQKRPMPSKKPAGWSHARWTVWRKRWGEWAETEKFGSLMLAIVVGKQRLVFVPVSRVRVPVLFLPVRDTKTIVPLAGPESFFEGTVVSFEQIITRDFFIYFLNTVVKSINPLVETPNKTLILINDLECCNDIFIGRDQKIHLRNCIVVFGPSDMKACDVYFTFDNQQFGVKRSGKDKPFTAGDVKEIPQIATMLADAITDHNPGLIGALVKTNPYMRDPSGKTALMVAAEHGCISAVRDLVKNHADLINQRTDSEGWTALMSAVLHEHALIVQMLLDVGADATLYTNGGVSALDLAHTPEISRLIENAVKKQEAVWSPGFKRFQRQAQKKALKMEQQSVARNVWKQAQAGAKFDIESIIKAQLMGFDMLIQRLVQERATEKKPAAPF